MDLEQLVVSMPFAVESGVRLITASPDEVHGVLDWSAERCTIGGALHGGILMTLADSVAAICAFLNLPEGASTSTIESKTNFFRGVRSGSVHVVSRPLHVGRRTIVVQSDLRDDADARVAVVLQTQAVLTW